MGIGVFDLFASGRGGSSGQGPDQFGTSGDRRRVSPSRLPVRGYGSGLVGSAGQIVRSTTGFLLGLMEPEKGDVEPEPDDAEETEEDPN